MGTTTGFVLVGGLPASGKTTLAGRLAGELSLPLLSKDDLKEALIDALGPPTSLEQSRSLGRAAVHALLRAARGCPGAVVDSTWYPYAGPLVQALPGPVVEVRCLAPVELMRRRYAARAVDRDPAHPDDARSDEELWGAPVEPLGAGPLLEVDTSAPVDVAVLAQRIRGLLAAPGHGSACPVTGTPVTPVDLLEQAYRPLLELAEAADESVGWTPTRLPGWTVRDLLFHLASDCQRALVALATPADQPADTDEVGYWSAWQPGTEDAAAGLRGTRLIATAWSSVRGPADLYVETAQAVLRTARGADPDQVVRTQGRTLRVGALLHTLAVEAGVHHLDLDPVLERRPAPEVLAAVRAVLDGLLGEPAPAGWADLRYIRLGTGRAAFSDAERRQLGRLAERFPLFG